MEKKIFDVKTTIPLITNSISRSPLWSAFLLIALVLACFAFSPTAQAQLPSPPPDGGYPGDNTAEGENALFSLTTGSSNTAIGFDALAKNTTGGFNTASGAFALQSNTFGHDNTATGFAALDSNTTGNNNTANGDSALLSNTEGVDNTAVGFNALASNTFGSQNAAIGFNALYNNTTSVGNTAVGWQALFSNKAALEFSPGFNTAIGFGALYSASSSSNTAIGAGALGGDTGGFDNTAVGTVALDGNTSGSHNIALGEFAGHNLTTGDDNIDIGNEGVADEANTIRIGTQGTQTRTFIAGISGTALGGGMAVRVNVNGRLGTAPSSARFKQNIKPMDKASEAILALKPVTFHYKKELDPEGIPQFGLVAENVEKVNPDLVARDDKGKIYTVRYDAVNAMLLNEFLKEHRTVQELKSTATTQEAIIAQLKSAIAQQQKDFATTSAQQQKEFESKIAHQQNEIEALTAGLQKVSAQLEVNKPLPQIVVSDQ